MILSVRVQKRLSASFVLTAEFSAAPGITMLFGASGSGKTTLLRCIAGLLQPDSGLIEIGDTTLFDSGRPVDVPVPQRKTGFLFQDLALFPHLTVEENVRYGLHGVDETECQTRTRAILKSFRIEHLLRRRPRDISGGERQRAALARTLVTRPRLLLLDEPLSALDHATQSHIMEDLRAWNAEHAIPILYVTHSQGEVFALGERVIVLHEGAILSEGAPQDVLSAPVHEPLARLTGFENFFDATVLSINPESGTMHCRLMGTRAEIEAPLSKAPVGSITRLAIRAGDILVAAEFPRALSARNILPGKIESLRREGPTVVATVAAGPHFIVHLTPAACQSLHLDSGREVWLVVKSHSFRIVAAGG